MLLHHPFVAADALRGISEWWAVVVILVGLAWIYLATYQWATALSTVPRVDQTAFEALFGRRLSVRSKARLASQPLSAGFPNWNRAVETYGTAELRQRLVLRVGDRALGFFALVLLVASAWPLLLNFMSGQMQDAGIPFELAAVALAFAVTTSTLWLHQVRVRSRYPLAWRLLRDGRELVNRIARFPPEKEFVPEEIQSLLSPVEQLVLISSRKYIRSAPDSLEAKFLASEVANLIADARALRAPMAFKRPRAVDVYEWLDSAAATLLPSHRTSPNQLCKRRVTKVDPIALASRWPPSQRLSLMARMTIFSTVIAISLTAVGWISRGVEVPLDLPTTALWVNTIAPIATVVVALIALVPGFVRWRARNKTS